MSLSVYPLLYGNNGSLDPSTYKMGLKPQTTKEFLSKAINLAIWSDIAAEKNPHKEAWTAQLPAGVSRIQFWDVEGGDKNMWAPGKSLRPFWDGQVTFWKAKWPPNRG